MKINTLPFSRVLTDSTKKFTKIKKQDYLKNGKYAIVDQGKDFICGYTNKEEFVNFDDNLLIIFGDHTKAFKYIDFPIAIGADGVKALTVDTQIADTKYIYYFLKSLKLYDAGYARHFKYLKVKKILLPEDKNYQIKIANLLTEVEELITKREESIELLDELLESTFLDMFGDPINNSQQRQKVRLDEIVVLQRGFDLPKSSRNIKGKIRLYGSNGIVDFHDESKLDKGIITGRSGTIGKVYYSDEPFWPLNTTLFSKDLKGNNIIYLSYLLSLFGLERFHHGAGVPTLNRNIVHKEKIYKVDIHEQEKFATIVQQVESTKTYYQDSLDELNELFSSLSQRAFRGELDLNGIPAIERQEIETISGMAKSGADVKIADTKALSVPSSSGALVDNIDESEESPLYPKVYTKHIRTIKDNNKEKTSLKKVLEITEIEIIDILKNSEQPLNLDAIVKKWHNIENKNSIHLKEMHYEAIKNRLLMMIEKKKIVQINFYGEALLGINNEA